MLNWRTDVKQCHWQLSNKKLFWNRNLRMQSDFGLFCSTDNKCTAHCKTRTANTTRMKSERINLRITITYIKLDIAFWGLNGWTRRHVSFWRLGDYRVNLHEALLYVAKHLPPQTLFQFLSPILLFTQNHKTPGRFNVSTERLETGTSPSNFPRIYKHMESKVSTALYNFPKVIFL